MPARPSVPLEPRYRARLLITARHTIPVEVAYADGECWTRALDNPAPAPFDWRVTEPARLVGYEEVSTDAR